MRWSTASEKYTNRSLRWSRCHAIALNHATLKAQALSGVDSSALPRRSHRNTRVSCTRSSQAALSGTRVRRYPRNGSLNEAIAGPITASWRESCPELGWDVGIMLLLILIPESGEC